MADDGKYYWLKLKRDFFKRHDIRIIESMPNGKDFILFYLKLLCESVDHEGNLRFSEQIPYNEDMLSTITNTNIHVVRAAIEVFTKLNMMEILDDGTYYMNEVNRMIGYASDSDNAIRQRRYRERKKINALRNVTGCVTKSNESKSIEIELELDKELELDNKESKPKKTKFTPPSIEEVKAYCDERGNNVDPEKFVAYYQSNGWRVGRNPMKDFKAAIRTWEKNNYSKPVNHTSNNRSGGNEFTAYLQQMEAES